MQSNGPRHNWREDFDPSRDYQIFQEMNWSSSLDVYDEYEKLVLRMNTPRVVIDNAVCENETLVKVDSANKHGILLEAVQVLTDLNLNFNKVYVSSDGRWFMDVFHVTDENGKKLTDEGVIGYIEKTLATNPACILPSFGKSVGVEVAADQHTAIELTGTDRPGLLSEIFSVLSDLKCNIVEAEVWTHNRRVACLVYITDEETSAPIEDAQKICKIEELLRNVMRGSSNIRAAKTAVAMGFTHTERRLHQLMFADRDYEKLDRTGGRASPLNGNNDNNQPLVTVDNCLERRYSVVNVQCKDRPKLLFDIVCTLTDMEYVVFHATVNSQGPQTFQEYYIKHADGCPVNSEAERQRVIQCLEAAIRRRASEGIGLELCTKDRVGLLSDVTRIFRENGMSVTRAEVSTRGDKAADVFYVTDTAGNPVDSKTVEAVRQEIGLTILQVKDNWLHTKSPPRKVAIRFSLGNLFKSKSERLLYSMGLIKSYS